MSHSTSNLLSESGPVYRPTLASYIGDNEAIFLSQLDFILKNRTTNIKQADGSTWYRQKPSEFALNEFPGWAESRVKRTINNLKNDGLILARSDLNDDRTRSLWYTINYHAVDNLTGPVYRLQAKAQKRTEASRAREVYSDDYTKVQNELLTAKQEKDGEKPESKPTTKVQSEQMIKVQNEPPFLKESLKNKDLKPSPNGEGPPPKLSPKKLASRQMFSAFVELCCVDLPTITEKKRQQINQAEKKMRENGYTSADLVAFGEWWFVHDWRGQKGQPPEIQHIRDKWGEYLRYKNGARNGHKTIDRQPNTNKAKLEAHLARLESDGRL